MRIVILGTAWPYRGGLATFNERLTKQFVAEGHDVERHHTDDADAAQDVEGVASLL